jgi:uncharacterized membrane protein
LPAVTCVCSAARRDVLSVRFDMGSCAAFAASAHDPTNGRVDAMAATVEQPQPQPESPHTVPDPLRHHRHYSDSKHGASPYAGGSSFMERVSEAVASGMGTVSFLVVSSGVILAWVFANHLVHFLEASWKGLLNGSGFDPAPFILLNLVFSAVAFFTGALVIIAQKAQTRTDKANEVAAAKHRDELSMQQIDLLQRNTTLTEQIHTLTEQLHALTTEVQRATCLPVTGGGALPTVRPPHEDPPKA